MPHTVLPKVNRRQCNAHILSILAEGFDNEQGTQAWLEERRRLITCSDVAAALNMNPYCSRMRLMRRKLGKEIRFQGNSATTWGTNLEPVAIRKYEDVTNQIVVPFGLRKHPEYSAYIGGSPDGLCLYGSGNGKIIEVKCPCK